MTRRFAGLACLILLSACGSNGGTATDSETGSDATAASEPVTLNVYAASSLKDTFTKIGKQFEADHKGVIVTFTFAGSSDLVAQIQQGAPADVFASADEKNMQKAVDDGLVTGTPQAFASNTLEIAVPPDNPANVKTLADLTKPDVDVVVCAPEVPCGSAATKVATAAKLTFHTVSEEQNVTDVLNNVVTGQAEAGLVYVTDVKSAGARVEGITFDESADAVNVYPIAAIKTAKHAATARAFTQAVLSADGQDVLRDAGFAKP